VASLEALHDAVCAAPDDDARRLAYANAVEPSDPDRAEYIRLTVQLAQWRRTDGGTPDERTKMSVRSRVLLDKHKPAWEANVRALVGSETGFYSGFPEYVSLPAARFLELVPELYRRAPIRHLDLTDVKPIAAALFGSPHLARIASLSMLRSELGDAEVKLLAQSPYLRRLGWLDLSLNSIGEAGLEALAASTRLPRLGYVSLADNRVEDPTPRHADEYDATSAVAKALQAKYGPRDWLDARPRSTWPPERDAL
jgi:uncharacterized protein (TIGR02996 family)